MDSLLLLSFESGRLPAMAVDARKEGETFVVGEKTREGAPSIFRAEKQLPHVYAPHSTHQSAFASTLAR